ncbi:glycoside hydrolase family protein [Chitinophaga tropicalis]|uniref:Glycoside hydrolase n=1 Tax=Chitinophaga tropicalis TaxID=2683588 RepID=A0A7K1UDQ0_9BACT|nr:glycoside hydrolase [Chitinophaga tropicalis]MVT12135.1 glycoside hydrolase [Chitinophaga tropicalis]
MLNSFSAVLAALGMSVSLLAGCGKNGNNDPAPSPTGTERREASAELTNGWGHGVNLQPSYYNGGNVTFGWSLMKSYTKIKTVRIEIEPTVSVTLAKSWIQQAISNGYAVIATYHKYTVLGSDDANELTAAANWWKNNYATLAGAGAFTINLMNEWGSHNITSNAYAAAYNNAISIVRQVYSGPIIIDCAGWGQETATAAAAVKGQGGTKINDTNIILSVHIYPNGWNQGKNRNLQNADLDDLASAGRPCIVGEFGNSPSGSVDWSGMVSYAKSKGWTVLGWCWNGDGGTMNMVSPAWTTNPTASSYSAGSYFNVIYNLL